MTDAPADSGAAKPTLPRRQKAAPGGEPLTVTDAAVSLARPPAELLQRVKEGLLDVPG